jgi:hypothetical protein
MKFISIGLIIGGVAGIASSTNVLCGCHLSPTQEMLLSDPLAPITVEEAICEEEAKCPECCTNLAGSRRRVLSYSLIPEVHVAETTVDRNSGKEIVDRRPRTLKEQRRQEKKRIEALNAATV